MTFPEVRIVVSWPWINGPHRRAEAPGRPVCAGKNWQHVWQKQARTRENWQELGEAPEEASREIGFEPDRATTGGPRSKMAKVAARAESVEQIQRSEALLGGANVLRSCELSLKFAAAGPRCWAAPAKWPADSTSALLRARRRKSRGFRSCEAIPAIFATLTESGYPVWI